MGKLADILLLQEHWLFDCNLHKLKEINSYYSGCGKAVDTGNPIPPIQMPRGYGGVAILWRHEIDHLIQVLPDGGNRIQCVELKGDKPLILVSVYMPCRGLSDNVDDYGDYLDQLREIVAKYSSSHIIVLGGDMNEDLMLRGQSFRAQLLKNFLNESELDTVNTGKTYSNPEGVLTSTLDYIFYSKEFSDDIMQIKSLEDLHTSVSDHTPVLCQIQYRLDKVHNKNSNSNLKPSMKVSWKKINQESYNSNLSTALWEFDTEITSVGTLDNSVKKLNEILDTSARSAAPNAEKRPRKAKLRIWTPDVQNAVIAKKKAFFEWKKAGRPEDKDNQAVINKKQTTILLRQICRREVSKKACEERQEIMDSRSYNMALFHRLVNKQRGRLSSFVNELHVGEDVYRSQDDILSGWRQHFKQLATPTNESCFDTDHRRLTEMELREIKALCQNPNDSELPISEEEVLSAIKSLNKGKSADIYNISAEHLAFGADNVVPVLTKLLNKMLHFGIVPDSLKLGVLTPVYKRKGSNLEAKNYRGITVTPILSKVLESVLRERINTVILEHQNKLQRGFTASSSPMNCSLILEESIRESKDNNLPIYIAFLDAKSAFDVVSHTSLLRKLYHIGIDGQCWNLIYGLHSDAETVVKWGGQLSDSFPIQQGVRQGGILSTDMYKVYNNKLLDRLESTMLGVKIGGINCVAPTCADDTTLLSRNRSALQTLINISVDYSNMEHYLLQPVKSVVLSVPAPRSKDKSEDVHQWTLKDEPMPNVPETMHMGIMRSANTEQSATRENIQKARRTLYSLMASGLHGENGLDPESAIQLMQTYVIPVLVYGMEIVLPKQKYMDMLEKFNKKFLKLILSLPVTAADPSVYVLSGTLPIEATIHKRVLTFFGNISRLSKISIEHQLAVRQLSVKSFSSHSWFIAVKEIFMKYNLPDPLNLLENPPTKFQWKKTVNEYVNTHWEKQVRESAVLYSSLRFLNVSEFSCGKRHPLLRSLGNIREVPRISIKLKLVTGTYIFQTNRATFNQNQVNPVCLLCHQENETTEHFLLHCPALASLRNPLIDTILSVCTGVYSPTNSPVSLLQLVLDHSVLTSSSTNASNKEQWHSIEFHCRRLCHILHCERYKLLSLVPKRQRKKKH